MRFLPHGPDIPDELISAQEKGQIIFVCGAGVSCAAGLPLFRGLVEGIYEKLGEDWNVHPAEREGMREDGRLFGQYDRVIRCLERRLGAADSPRNCGMRERIRRAIRQVLAAPKDANLANHLALLELSRDAEGQIRLLTTNFDTLFERAWFREVRRRRREPCWPGNAAAQDRALQWCSSSRVDERRVWRRLFEVRLGVSLRLRFIPTP